MKSNADWIEWGKRDPYYAVASSPDRRRGGSDPWTEEDFYASGASSWPRYRTQWEGYGINKSVCLEIGAGAGRITESLARDFDVVHAVDISPDMLALARRRITAERVHFHLTRGTSLPLPDRSVTAVLSTFVFQHFDSMRDAARYFEDVVRVMAPGATLMIQLPVYASPIAPNVVRVAYVVQRFMGHAHAWLRRRLMAFGGKPVMRGLKYEVSWLQQALALRGLTDIEIHIIGTQAQGDPLSFVFARKC